MAPRSVAFAVVTVNSKPLPLNNYNVETNVSVYFANYLLLYKHW